MSQLSTRMNRAERRRSTSIKARSASPGWRENLRAIALIGTVGLLFGACFYAVSAKAANAPAMMTPGTLNVSASGAAMYTMPIAVPPGSGGMVPALSLGYSSQAGDGFVGLGWSLSGLPSIMRCARTVAQDNVRGLVNYTIADQYCMDGQRLILIAGTHGTDGAEYRTEIDGFSKIVAVGSGAKGPNSFKVWTKAGQVMEFGNTTDSRNFAVGNTAVRVYAVNKISDTKANYLTVTYTNDTVNGQIYPTRIDYTGNGSVTPYSSVQFSYNTNRPDQVTQYHAGSLLRATVLLTNVKTYAGTVASPSSILVSDYQITYNGDASLTKRSRVTSIKLCDGASLCMPATTFGWQGTRDTVTYTSQANNLAPGATLEYRNLFPGDYNGDGVTDLAAGQFTFGQSCPGGRIYYGNQSSTFTSANATATYNPNSAPYVTGSACVYVHHLSQLDYNGDGLTDHEITDEATLHILLKNNGNGTFSEVSRPTGYPNVIADFDGDGRTDRYSQGAGFIYYSNGNGTFTSVVDDPTWNDNNSYQAADFNGDGCADMMLQGNANYIRYFCTTQSDTVLGNWSAGYQVVLGDFNGDGKTDIFRAQDTGFGVIQFSTGTGLTSNVNTLNLSWGAYQILGGDWNGDGKTDLTLIKRSSGDHLIYLSTGAGFTSTPVATISNTDGNCNELCIVGTVADWNNNGASDIWIQKPSGDTQYLFAFTPELMTTVDNGLGIKTTVTYDRLNRANGLYTKGTGNSYPYIDVIGPMYVVSKAQSGNGLSLAANQLCDPAAGQTTNCYESTYTYGGLVANYHGRGTIGFTWRKVTDTQTQVVQTTNYSSTFPFIGLTTSETKVRGAVTLNSTTNTFGSKVANALEPGLTTRFAYMSKSVETRRDLNNAAFADLTTTFSYDCDAPASYRTNCYGYTTQTVAKVGNGGPSTKTTTNTYNAADTTNWILGRLKTATTVSSIPGATATRKSCFVYDLNNGLLTKEMVEHTSTTDCSGVGQFTLETNYVYDSFGNKTSATVTGGLNETVITSRTTQSGYDTSSGRFTISATNALSQSESWVFDSAGGYQWGLPTSQTGPNNLTTSWAYDTFGRKTLETRPDGNKTQTEYKYCTTIPGGTETCPSNAAFVVIVTPKNSGGTQNGAWAKAYYDGLSRVVATETQPFSGTMNIWVTTEYDTFGRVYRTSRPYYAGATPKWNTNVYDELGRVIQSKVPTSTGDFIVAEFTFDAETTTVTKHPSAGVNQATSTLKNDLGQVISVTDAMGKTSTYHYDAHGNQDRITDCTNCGTVGNNITTFVYDIRGHKIQNVDPDLGTWTYVVDVLGNVKTQTNQNGPAGAQQTVYLTSGTSWPVPSNWNPYNNTIEVIGAGGGGEGRGSGASQTIILTSGSTWTVPGNWNNSNNSIEVIGGGGSGRGGTGNNTGGGGGAYAKVTNVAISGTVTILVGSGGSAGGNGSDGTESGVCTDLEPWADCTGVVWAAGGAKGGTTSGGAGGSTAASFGTVLFAGGAGGNATLSGGAGGGGAAGPGGAGKNAGNVTSTGGSGGGGAGGASSTNGSNSSTSSGSNGGNGPAGSGGGLGAGPGGAGSNGGGGGGGNNATNGGVGGAGTEWTTHGAGGGGGGGGSLAVGGAGGLYGAGGGSGATPGDGADGVIIIKYTPSGATPGDGGGGGGGAYAKATNVVLTSATVTYSIGTAGQGGPGTGNNPGGVGGDTYFCSSNTNCASITDGAVAVGAKGGAGGSLKLGGAGGSAASSIGSVKFNGGNGAGDAGTNIAGGGGGAGGLNAAGNNASAATGGRGDGTFGGLGGAGGNPGAAGQAGTEWDATHGSGGGGGGGSGGTARNGGQGGLYGAGGGGGTDGGGAGGNGRAGLVVIKYTAATTQTATMTFDLLNRMITRTEPDLYTTWTFGTSQANKNVGQPIEAKTCTTSGCSTVISDRDFTYDSLGRVSTNALTVGGSTNTYTTTYTSDGRVDTIAYPSGFVVKHTYTATTGFLSQLKNNADSSVLWTANTMDQEGHLIQHTAGNGVVTNLDFDDYSGLIDTIQAGPSNNKANFNYDFDKIGNLTQRYDAIAGGSPLTERFCYDELNRLTDYSTSASGCSVTGSKNIVYSAIGNITFKTDVGTYTYPTGGSGRPHAVSSIGGPVLNTTYTYDNVGNMLTGASRTVTWTSYNMASSMNRASNTVCFAYDADHQRIKMEQRSGTNCSATLQQTTWYVNGAGVRAEKVVAGATTTWKDYLFAGGLMVGQRDTIVGGATSVQYFVLDHLGSVAVVLDSAGNLQTNGRLSYDAWGNRRLTNGSDGTPAAAPTTRGFTGHEMIDSIGLVNMNGRVYDPFIGRFMSADPVTEDTFAMQLLNHYSYVGNNPLSYTDMTGFGIFRQILAVVVAVAIAILLPELLGTYLAEVLNFAAIGSSQFIGIAALTFGVAGGAAGAISTGSLSGALLGAAGGFVFGAIAPGLGATFGNWLGNPTIGSAIGKGFAGGLQNVITGGKFSSGFLSAGFSELANPITPAIGKGGLVVSSIAGGAGSILGGGKFANGAVTGAFAYLASSAAESMGRRSSEAGDGYDSRRTADSQEPSNLFGGELYDIADAQVTINRATHEAAVAREVQQWRSRGFIVTPGVTFFDPKSGLIVIADYVVSFRVGDPLSFFILPKPEPILVRDVKTGRGGLTDNQYHVYPHMMSGGVVVPVGPNAFLAGFEIGYPVSVGEMYVGGELPPFTNQ